MSCHNYGQSGYGFWCDSCEFEKVVAFIKKHMPEDWDNFKDCENLDDIEEVCSRMGDWGGYYDANQILAHVIHYEVHDSVDFYDDDSYGGAIMLVPFMPWVPMKPITQEEFEKKAGDLAMEFYGNPVKFDWITTQEWG